MKIKLKFLILWVLGVIGGYLCFTQSILSGILFIIIFLLIMGYVWLYDEIHEDD